ncbi:type III pantothenate kinase [Acidihalobacter aeolianus]|uniref:type III pantothenate kinase n=1 Tax=Acidihalobacter aeolianus TaxID=2792603 RepID=UPI0009F52181|nr:type III pantothenate kinase [Acidihalobacter aeolianus]
MLVDLGNTRAKWCRFDGAHMFQQGWCTTDLELLYQALISLPFAKEIDSMIVSSVIGDDACDVVSRAAKAMGITNIIWLSVANHGHSIMPTTYNDPTSLGIDRLLACAAAYAITREQVIVIDAGSATTIDFVSKSGVHKGGVIVAGMNAIVNCVSGKIPALKSDISVSKVDPLMPVQNDTKNALLYGGLYAWVGGIRMVVDEIISSLDSKNCVIFVTGGDALLLSSFLKITHRVDKALVFKGMAVFEGAAL